MRFLIIGGDSGLGQHLQSRLEENGHDVVSTSRREGAGLRLDLSSDITNWEAPGTFDVAFLFAAVCSLDAVERDPIGTRRINVDNTVLLAKKLIGQGCRVVFPSTNQVFDGSTPCPSVTSDVSPTSAYGKQKAETETRILSLGGLATVIRYSKILQTPFPLLSNWRNALAKGEQITPLSDLYFAPVPLDFAMTATIAISTSGKGGIWHISGDKDLSYAEAAQAIAADLQAPQSLIAPISIAESKASIPAAPRHTALDTSRLKQDLGLTAPDVLQTIIEASHA